MLAAILIILSNTIVTHALMFVSGAFVGKAYLEHIAAEAQAALPSTVAQLKAQAAPVLAQATTAVAAAPAGIVKNVETAVVGVASAIEAKL
jgi:hypothetical protein